MKEPLNILFIMTDHQRADSIGMVQSGGSDAKRPSDAALQGSRPETPQGRGKHPQDAKRIEVTPNLNRLAAEGTFFSRAYNTCPLCVPARTALATGKYPTRNGVVFNDWKGERAGDHKPIHQYLYEAGYQVGHIEVHHIRGRPPFEKRLKFSKWVTGAHHARFLAQEGIQPMDRTPYKSPVREYREGKWVETAYSNPLTGVWPHPAEYFLDMYFCAEATRFIKELRETPFALFVYLWAPHPPLIIPEPFASKFDPASLQLPPNVGEIPQGEPPKRRKGIAAQMAENISISQWRKAWAAHLGLVNMADAGIGQILEALKRSGKAESTLVIFTVDHGDLLGQHQMYQKMEMYEQAIRVPLIFRGPGIKKETFDTPVSHLDIMPTLLEMVGISYPDDLDGISLRKCLAEGTPPPERPIFSQYSGNPAVGDIRRAVITRKFKFVYDPQDLLELFDLEADPLEMHNLAGHPENTPLMRRLFCQCKKWAETHNDWVQFSETAIERHSEAESL
jgi:arylsulfatase A-like enzyme